MAENTDFLMSCIDCGADFLTEGELGFNLSEVLETPKRCNHVVKRRRPGLSKKKKE